MFPGVFCLLALLSFGLSASGEATTPPAGNGLRGSCDKSFPLAAPAETGHHRQRFVSIPNDETRRSYAPICPDGRRVDIRRIQNCPAGSCWAAVYQSCMHVASDECGSQDEGSNNNSNSDGGGLELPSFNIITNPNEQSEMATFNSENSNEQIQSCQPGQCFVSIYQLCLHITSQECRNPPTEKPTQQPTPSPTAKPTFGMETTIHPVMLVLENVASGYQLTADIRALIIRHATESIEAYLEEPMELIKVEFGGNLDRRLLSSILQKRRRLDEVSVPLLVTVKGPSNMSDFVLSYVMDTVQDHVQDLESKLKSNDPEGAFKDVSISAETYNVDDIMEETKNPTLNPSRRPSMRPSQMPTRIPSRRPSRRPTPMPTTQRPTPRPTPNPTSRMEETVHPVQLIFKNVPPGYRLSAVDRASIIRFVKEMIEDNLDERLELIEVSNPGILIQNGGNRRLYSPRPQHARRLDTHSLPLLIKVKGAADLSDFALFYVMEVFEDTKNIQDLCRYLKSLDIPSSSWCGVTAETYDLGDIVGDTDMPTLRPTLRLTSEPTRRPTPRPTPEPLSRFVETVYPVQLIFKSVPAGYTFSSEARASLIRFIKEILEDNLSNGLQLIEVSYAGILLQSGARFLQSGVYAPKFPLLIGVRGPSDISDFALSYILQVLRDNMQDIENFLQSLDGKAFVKPKTSVETYGLADISDTSKMETTVHPVQLIFKSVPAGYAFSSRVRASLLRFIGEMLEDGLGGAFKLIEASYADIILPQSGARFLQAGAYAPSLPLLIRVRGPSDLSNFALPYIIQVLRDNMQDIEIFLLSLDGKAFVEPEVSVDTYDLDDISDDPYNWPEVMNEGEDLPWWVWLLVTIGILFLLCCLCICCRYMYVYKKYKDEYNHRKREDEYKSREDKVIERQLVVEKPVIVERPVFIEKQAKERPKKHKKHRKKKKRRSKRPKMLQIERQKSYEGPMIAIPYDHMTARSSLTFDIDPPSEAYLPIQGEDPYHGRLLAPPADTPLALPAPAEEHSQILCAEPSVYHDGYSASDPSQGNALAMMYDGDDGSQSYYAKDPSGLGWHDNASQPHYTKEPSGLGLDGNASQSHYAKESSGHSRNGNASQAYYAKEPSGHEWAEIQSYVTQEAQPFHTQPPRQEPRHEATTAEDSIFATFDDPSFAIEEHQDSVFSAFRRHQSGGISSDDDSDALVYPHPTSTSF